MNRKMVLNTIGRIMVLEATLMLIPATVSLIYKEFSDLFAFLITIGISALLGLVTILLCRTRDHVIYARDGFITVGLAWIVLSLIGALPFYISQQIPHYIDAFFEIVSGFTTTGASILKNVEAMSHGMLFWRSFTHWIGGMGVLVLIMAIIPNVSDRSIHIMRAEMPGPVVDKLLPRIKDTAKILYIIYIVLTATEVIMLLFGGMPLYDSLVHTFGTAGTGGFGIKADSIAGYSPYLQWVITIFMLIFGVNFNIYFLILIKKFKSALKSSELWTYLGIVASAIGIITINIHTIYGSFSETLRHSAFQVASITTTTGFSTADFNAWPTLSKAILVLLMFIGACAGSTAGGIKVSRVVIIFKMIGKEFGRLLRPRSVKTIKHEGKIVEEKVLTSVTTYLAVYIVCFVAVFLLLSFDKFGFETNFTAAAACFNNIGPGLANVGPISSYADYSIFSKIILSVAMLLGRLEIFPLIIAFSPTTWSKK